VVGVDTNNRVYIVEVKYPRSDLLKDSWTMRDRARLSEDLRGYAEDARDVAAERAQSAQRRLASFSIKFHDPAYFRPADFHYLIAPHGLIWPSDLPPFWGLMNERGEHLAAAPQKQVRRVTAHVLRSIGKANTRDIKKIGLSEPAGSKTGSD
jgi:hypothetical protein